MAKGRTLVSLTIPCYNEGPFVFKAVKELDRVMAQSPWPYEIILFDDKSLDETAKNIARIAEENPKIRAFFHEENQGRGQTVKDAIAMAKGSIVGFVDIDLEVAAHYVPAMVNAIEEGYDVAVADRIGKLGFRSLQRHFLSKMYQTMVRKLLNIGVNDTEAGCKFFNKERIMPILSKTKNKHWFWDTEIMALAQYNGLRIKEISVVFSTNPETESTVKIFSDSVDYLKQIWRFRNEMKKEGFI